jgi:hypothetical protein
VAAGAATAARNAILGRAAGIEVHDGDMVTVSRAAADAARGLVAGCHLTGAYPFALSCEPVASPDPTAAKRPPGARRQAA